MLAILVKQLCRAVVLLLPAHILTSVHDGKRNLLCVLCSPNDMRIKNQPRWAKENFNSNLLLVEEVKRLAAKKGVTPGQLSLAWVHHQVGMCSMVVMCKCVSHLWSSGTDVEPANNSLKRFCCWQQ